MPKKKKPTTIPELIYLTTAEEIEMEAARESGDKVRELETLKRIWRQHGVNADDITKVKDAGEAPPALQELVRARRKLIN